MANEDILKKDLITELKNKENDSNQDHLEPVNVIIGRFQPFTIGHLGMAKELQKINDLPSVYIYIRSKSGKNSKFTDKLTINYMEDVVKGQKMVKDAWDMSASFIPVIIKETQRRGYNPVLIGAGEDRAKSYTSMAKRMKDINVHPEFKIQELKGRLTSATEVRQAILDDDIKKFNKLVPKQVQPYYKQLKDELENSSELVESISVGEVLMNYDLSTNEISKILELYGEDLFSDAFIIESILNYELSKNNRLDEGIISDINVIFQETKDFDEFKKIIKNKYKKISDEDILNLYKDNEQNILDEQLIQVNTNALIKSHKQLFERIISFRKGKINLSDIDKDEKSIVVYLSKLSESKLTDFLYHIKDMQINIETDINKPMILEDYKSISYTSDFFKKKFKPLLMMENLNDYQIDDIVEKLISVNYKQYVNLLNK